MPNSESVKVAVRCRPPNQREISQNEANIVSIASEKHTVAIENPKKEGEKPLFTFDFTYGQDCQQRQVYEDCAKPLVECVLDGYNATIFAYGQTGTGKSFSMTGVPENPELRGIIPNSFEHIFQAIAGMSDRQTLVRCSYLEIYNEEIRDLLANSPAALKRALDLGEHPDRGVYVKELSQFIVKNPQEMYNLMDQGGKNRAVGATNMNAQSSRSHSIFTIIVETCDKTQGAVKAGKLNLVDLAGSERQSKTGAEGERLKEAVKINLSLSALGNVIAALVDGSKHVPYRDSKLTRLLQDSLGGNAKTMMMATISPAAYNFDETLSTLQYAARTKKIQNKPIVNEDPKDALLRQYQDEIKSLRLELALLQQSMGSNKVAPITQTAVMDAEPKQASEPVAVVENTAAPPAASEPEPAEPVKSDEATPNAVASPTSDDQPLIAEEEKPVIIETKEAEDSAKQLSGISLSARQRWQKDTAKTLHELDVVKFLSKQQVKFAASPVEFQKFFPVHEIKNLPRFQFNKNNPDDVDLEKQTSGKIVRKYLRRFLCFLTALLIFGICVVLAISLGAYFGVHPPGQNNNSNNNNTNNVNNQNQNQQR